MKNCLDGATPVVCTAERRYINPSVSSYVNRLDAMFYTYDAAGHLTEDAYGTEFTYDAEGRQTDSELFTTSFGQSSYDGDGRRVKTYTPGNGETVVFVYDAFGRMLAEYDTTVQTGSNAKIAYLTADNLGSPRINTDGLGNVISRHDYHPFGEDVSTTQRTSGVGYQTDTIRKKFTGYETDGSGLYFAQARFYSGGFGRFTSPDPLAASAHPIRPQSWNRYSYVYNNPYRFADPSGMLALGFEYNWEQGDYYDEDGNYIGNDGNNDGRIFFVYDEQSQREIRDGRDANTWTYTGDVVAKQVVESRDIVTSVAAVTRSRNSTWATSGFEQNPNTQLARNQRATGGFRETGVSSNAQGTVRDHDGPYQDPRPGVGTIDIQLPGDSTTGVHVHPDGVVTTSNPGMTDARAEFRQELSTTDINNAFDGTNIMIGAASRRVTFYGRGGIYGTMSLEDFSRLGTRQRRR